MREPGLAGAGRAVPLSFLFDEVSHMTAQSEHIVEQCHCTVCRLRELDTQSNSHNSSGSGFAIAAREAASLIPVRGAAVNLQVVG